MSAAAAGAPASTAPRLPPELQAEVDRYKSIQAGVWVLVCGDPFLIIFVFDVAAALFVNHGGGCLCLSVVAQN